MSVTIRIVLIVLLVVGLVAYRRGKGGDKPASAGKGKLSTGTFLGGGKAPKQVEAVVEDAGGLPAPEKVAPGIERKLVDVGEREFWYLEGGAQQPVSVLLLHGFAGDKEQWLPVMSHLLGRGFRVVAPDLPGCGQNDKDPEDSYDVMSQVSRIRAFVHRVGIRTTHLVGISMGGTVAAALAYGVQDLARSLTMIEPFGLRVPRQSELDTLLEQGRNPLIIAAPAAYDNLVGFLCTRPVADRFKRQRAERLAADRVVNMKIWKEVREGERANLLDLLLPELSVRTLVIQGSASKIVHPASVEVIRGMMSNVQTVVLEDCGHLAMVEKPAETGKHIATFLLPPGTDSAAASSA